MEIVLKDRQFWRKRQDGSLAPLAAPRGGGLASQTFAATGANRKPRR